MRSGRAAFTTLHSLSTFRNPIARCYQTSLPHSRPSQPQLYRPRAQRATTMTSAGSQGEKTQPSASATFKLALCQVPVVDDKPRNLSVARSYLLRASQGGAQLAVLPECFNCPYGTEYFRAYAEKLPSLGADQEHGPETLSMLQEAAQETGMYIVGGSIPEESDGSVYNCSLTVSPQGKLVAKHRKAHLFDIDVPGGIRFKESDVLSAGASATAFSAEELGCTIGVGICYDVRFPELAMVQARDLGAKVLVYPGAFNMTTGPAHWELLLRARALDNQVFMAACSPARDEEGEGYKAWGHSMVVDPWGSVIASTAEKPDIVFADVDLGRLDSVRTSIPTSVQRRTDIYELHLLKK